MCNRSKYHAKLPAYGLGLISQYQWTNKSCQYVRQPIPQGALHCNEGESPYGKLFCPESGTAGTCLLTMHTIAVSFYCHEVDISFLLSPFNIAAISLIFRSFAWICLSTIPRISVTRPAATNAISIMLEIHLRFCLF